MKVYLHFLTVVSVASVMLFSCNKADRVSLQGTVSGIPPDSALVLKRLDINSESVVDTLTYDDRGNFSYRYQTSQPGYYFLYAGGVKVASLVLMPGDRVKVKASATDRTCNIDGSGESLLYKQADSVFGRSFRTFDSLYVIYKSAPENEKDSLSLQLGRMFIKYKQTAIRFMYSNPRSFVNTAVAFHAFPDQMYVFSDAKDAPLLKRVYDSLQPLYPASVYVTALRERYEALEKALYFDSALSKVVVTDFPDICVPDLKGQPVCLSSLKGKTILVSFWHSQNVDMRLDNRELLDLYDEFSGRGLEVYQVALDTDKTLWASTVREQALPWINVCDGLGVASSAVATYNISQIPAYFIIGSDAEIKMRLNSMAQVEKEIRLLFGK